MGKGSRQGMLEEHKAVSGESGQTHVLSQSPSATTEFTGQGDTDPFSAYYGISYVYVFTLEMPK